MVTHDDVQVKQRFGAQVRARRRALKLSQEALGDRADLHRTYVSQLERGLRNVALCNIVRLAQALETTPSELLEGLGAPAQ
jgi:transcriptional regulator with XRE-family HTH domain